MKTPSRTLVLRVTQSVTARGERKTGAFSPRAQHPGRRPALRSVERIRQCGRFGAPSARHPGPGRYYAQVRYALRSHRMKIQTRTGSTSSGVLNPALQHRSGNGSKYTPSSGEVPALSGKATFGTYEGLCVVGWSVSDRTPTCANAYRAFRQNTPAGPISEW